MRARFPGKCVTCASDISVGEEITRVSAHGYAHTLCTVRTELPNCNKCGASLMLGYKARGLCIVCENAMDQHYKESNRDGWTPEMIKLALEVDNLFVERAVSALFERQETDEQLEEQTKVLNRRGFSAADAKRLSKSAKWFRSGRRIDGWFLEETRRRLMKYAKQLAQIANERAQQKARQRVEKDATGEPIPNQKSADDFNQRWLEYKHKFAQRELTQERKAFEGGMRSWQ